MSNEINQSHGATSLFQWKQPGEPQVDFEKRLLEWHKQQEKVAADKRALMRKLGFETDD